jgi:hypothetical protein
LACSLLAMTMEYLTFYSNVKCTPGRGSPT